MKLTMPIVACVLSQLANVAVTRADDVPDAKLLKDSWKFLSGNQHVNLQWGLLKKIHFADKENVQLEFQRHKLEGTYEIDPDKEPKRIKMVFRVPQQKRELLGIYRFPEGRESNDVEILWYAVGNEYPPDFKRETSLNESKKATRLVLRRASSPGLFLLE